jgi:methyl-coenzyme M reductase subunit D
MMKARFPQVRIVPRMMLKPDTAEELLEALARIPGIRRMMIHGPALPVTVPYGPARGSPNPHSNRKTIQIGDTAIALRVQVGQIVLEIGDESAVEEIKTLCDGFFQEFPYQLQEGRFMKTEPTLTDYARYGPHADERLIGLADPRNKEVPAMISPDSAVES